VTQTYILVHGAWHGAWCWDKFIRTLEQAGHEAVAFDLPAHGRDRTPVQGLARQHYVERVIQAIDAQRQPVVLVGHSLGGLTISSVAEQRPDKIKVLVYLTAVLLRNGESLPEVAARNEPSLVASNLSLSPDGTMSSVNLDQVKEIFYADCSDLDIERAKELLGPEPLGPRAERVRITDQRFGRVPRVYIECLQDNAIRPSFQKNMYTATPCKTVYSINTSHSPFLSAPAELAGILADV
jgi:pimeloyl-ACP methyl ester carboxylesterase